MQSSTGASMTDLSSKLNQFISQVPLSPQLIKKLPTLVNVLLVTLLAVELADFTWKLFPTAEITTVQSTAVARPPVRQAPPVSLANIPMLHLLGVAEQNNVNEKKGPINAPETQLKLELRGVFASDEASRSLAIIATRGGKDMTYVIGDSIPGGALLHEVYKDRVILSRNGRFETLRLRIPEAKISISGSNSSSYIPGAGVRPHSSPRINEFKETFRKDPQSIWNQIRITPVTLNGSIDGYHFIHNDRRLMKDLGISEQDVIVAINGTQVSDNAALFSMMKEIGSMTELELSVRRNNKIETVYINFE